MSDNGKIFCPNCGTENELGSLFCCECGSELAAAVPENTSPREKAYIDRSVSESDVVFCPNCGTPNKQDDMFCSECGCRLYSAIQEDKSSLGNSDINTKITNNNSSNNGWFLKFLAFVALVCIAALVYLHVSGQTNTYPGQKTINPFEDLYMNVKGISGANVTKVYYKSQKAYEQVNNEIRYLYEQIDNTKSEKKIQKYKERIELLHKLVDSISFDVSSAQNIYNNVPATVYCIYDENLLKESGYTIGYVSATYTFDTLDEPNGKGRVTDDNVRVRTGPGTNYQVLQINGKNQFYTKGSLLYITDTRTNNKNERWYEVVYIVGDSVNYTWIRSDYLRLSYE